MGAGKNQRRLGGRPKPQNMSTEPSNTPTPGSGNEPAQNQPSGQGETPDAPKNWDEWHESLSDDLKGLIKTRFDDDTKGLKSALESERSAKKELEKQLREVAAKAEKGSEFEKQLTELAGKLESEGKRAEFYEAAHKSGVTNLKLAWRVAQEDELFKRDGSPDIDALKADYPELFKQDAPPPSQRTNAGAGTNGNAPAKQTMNDIIRQAAGKSS
jgi:hypothetical protein